MSFGSISSQPFNPTANTGESALRTGMQGLGQLPGAQDPNSQQYFQQMHKSMDGMNEALQNIERSPQGQFGGGKGGSMIPGGSGGKYESLSPSMPTQEWHGAQTQPFKFDASYFSQ
jgi:hypothetical protein